MDSLELTKVESALFNRILQRKESPLGLVIKDLGLHKGTAYNSIRRLQEKGYVSYKNVAGTNIYSVNWLALQKLCSEEAVRYHDKVKEINQIIELAKKAEGENPDTKIDVLLGPEGFKSFLESLYTWAYKTKKEYLFLGEIDKLPKYIGKDETKRLQIKEKKLKLRRRMILTEPYRPVHGDSSANIRYLKIDAPLAIWIYADTVALVLWDSRPLSTLVIKSLTAANSFRNYFESLWPGSSGPKIKLSSRFKINIFDLVNRAQNSLDMMGIDCLQPVHEGKSKIIQLLDSQKRVRVLTLDPKSEAFRKRVFLEEQYIKDLGESRILFELKSVIANLKDIAARTKHPEKLEVRFYDSKPESSKIIFDKELLYNPYADTKGEYGSTQQAILLNQDFDEKEFNMLKAEFEELWNRSKPVKL